MYCMSRYIHSSKEIWLRPLTCQMQVRPGRTERRRRCHGSYFATSRGHAAGAGPTMLMSPRSTLMSCGSSSMRVLADEAADAR